MTHDENAFVAVLEFSKELPAHDWNKKKSEIRHIEENKRNGLTLPMSSFTQGSTAECQGRLSRSVISFMDESEHVWVSTWLPPNCAECRQGGPLLSHPVQNTEACCTVQGWRGLREQQAGHSEGIERTRVLLSASWNQERGHPQATEYASPANSWTHVIRLGPTG